MKVVVITGAGEKSFAAGLDVKEVDGKSLPEMMNFWPCSRDVYEQVGAIEKPAIAAKLHIDHGIDMDLQSALIYEGECFTLSYTSEDDLEGLSSSVEKRKPQFKDRWKEE